MPAHYPNLSAHTHSRWRCLTFPLYNIPGWQNEAAAANAGPEKVDTRPFKWVHNFINAASDKTCFLLACPIYCPAIHPLGHYYWWVVGGFHSYGAHLSVNGMNAWNVVAPVSQFRPQYIHKVSYISTLNTQCLAVHLIGGHCLRIVSMRQKITDSVRDKLNKPRDTFQVCWIWIMIYHRRPIIIITVTSWNGPCLTDDGPIMELWAWGELLYTGQIEYFYGLLHKWALRRESGRKVEELTTTGGLLRTVWCVYIQLLYFQGPFYAREEEDDDVDDVVRGWEYIVVADNVPDRRDLFMLRVEVELFLRRRRIWRTIFVYLSGHW